MSVYNEHIKLADSLIKQKDYKWGIKWNVEEYIQKLPEYKALQNNK
ncbi:MAG TPA: hypothetical protein PLP27_09210 [Crocinitomicaceae bacterium]|nr:hypothetical protein [Crocinitomicaceae bacterium]